MEIVEVGIKLDRDFEYYDALLRSKGLVNDYKVRTHDIYYTNPNGINLTEKEYNLVKTMFDDHFLEIMNQEDYNYINRLDVNNKEVEVTVKEPDYIQSGKE